MKQEAQTLSVKRAQVEFHNFASLGEPERALPVYQEENQRRGALLRKHLAFVGSLSPFLELGANAGHTSYMLVNEFGASGFALDISADALRHGMVLQERWQMPAAPLRIAGDAVRLPFHDGSLRFVCAFQMLSQFMNLDQVFGEVDRVLAPGGVFFFAEEPMKRLLTLGLYRCPYWEQMKSWERKLHEWGLLGFLVRDVIGAQQEEGFGIRQNHRLNLRDWHELVQRYFAAHEYEVFVPQRGWGERAVRNVAVRLDPFGSEWRAARLLGGTLAAFCKKAGSPEGAVDEDRRPERYLRCPDCKQSLQRDPAGSFHCTACPFEAINDRGVYNLIRTPERQELYPGDRQDIIDFSRPGHERRLLEGWYDVEGPFGNRYRWMGGRATARLRPVTNEPQRLRIRGHAPGPIFEQGQPVTVSVTVNGHRLASWMLDRQGLFVKEVDLPSAPEYLLEIRTSPVWRSPQDVRRLSINFSMLRLVPRD